MDNISNVPECVCVWAKEGIYAIDVFMKTDQLSKRARHIRRPRIDCTVDELFAYNGLPQKITLDMVNFQECSINDLAALYIENEDRIGICNLARFPKHVRTELESAILIYPESFWMGIEKGEAVYNFLVMSDMFKRTQEIMDKKNA